MCDNVKVHYRQKQEFSNVIMHKPCVYWSRVPSNAAFETYLFVVCLFVCTIQLGNLQTSTVHMKYVEFLMRSELVLRSKWLIYLLTRSL